MPGVLKAVIVDVDGTLYNQTPVRRYVAGRMLGFAALHPIRAWRDFRAVAAYRRAQEHLRVAGAAGGAHLQIAEASRRTGYSEAFVGQSVERWMNSVPLPSLHEARLPGLVPFLDWARGEAIQLGVVSDYDARGKLEALEIDQYFSVVVCAQDEGVGVFKPDPAGLLVAMRRLNVVPSEAIYVGDRMEVDGAAAVAAGIAGVVISAKEVDSLRNVVVVDGWSHLRPLIQERIQSGMTTGD